MWNILFLLDVGSMLSTRLALSRKQVFVFIYSFPQQEGKPIEEATKELCHSIPSKHFKATSISHQVC